MHGEIVRSASAGAAIPSSRARSVPSSELRLATPADVEAIRRLIDESVRALSVGYYSETEIESGLRFVFGPDSQLIADGTYFVIDGQSGLAASGGWSRRSTLYGGDQFKNREDPLLDPATDAARIRAFFVHPSYARRGLGRQIYEACEQAARGEGFCAMELGATLPGVPLYLALGFEERGRVDTMMPDGVTLPIVRMFRRICQRTADPSP
ncbi:MAG: GNAT family N-acetyltransferase [Gemmatimonadaceae bacterium]